MKIGCGFRKLVFLAISTALLHSASPPVATAQSRRSARPPIVPGRRTSTLNDSLGSALLHSLPVSLCPQETEDWCWAACGQMIMEYLGRNVTQCEQVNNRYGRTECCSIDVSAPKFGRFQNDSSVLAYLNCARSGWPEFRKYNFAFRKKSNEALTWDELRNQLSAGPNARGKPVAFSWRWNNGGGHMMVAKGYTTIDGTNYVIVLDPWPVNKGDEVIIPYSAYVDDPGRCTHWDDYYDIEVTREE
jgi:hypothetical protein